MLCFVFKASNSISCTSSSLEFLFRALLHKSRAGHLLCCFLSVHLNYIRCGTKNCFCLLSLLIFNSDQSLPDIIIKHNKKWNVSWILQQQQVARTAPTCFVRGMHFNSLVSTSAQSNREALINSLPLSTRLCPSSLHLKDFFLPWTSKKAKRVLQFPSGHHLCSWICEATLGLCPPHLFKPKSLSSLNLIFLSS